MPRIPVYNQPQIQPHGIQGGQRNPNAPAAAFGMGLGESVERAAGIMQETQREVDETRYFKAMNQVMAADAGLQADYQSKQGDVFLSIGPTKYIQDREAKVQEITKDLPANVRSKVLLASERSGIAFKEGLDRHILSQHDFLKRTNAASSADAAANYADSHPHDQAGIESRMGLALAAMDAANPGWSPETRAQQSKSLMAGILVKNAYGLLRDDPKKAQEFFDKNAEAMSASAHFSELKSRVRVTADFDLGQTVAQDNVSPFIGEENKKDGIPETGILGNIMQDARLKGNERATQHALAIAKELISTQRADWKEQTNRHIASVMNVSNQRGPGAALRSQELKYLQAVDPTEGDRIKNHLLSEIDASMSRATQEPVDPQIIAKRGFLFNDLLTQAMTSRPDGKPLTRDDVIASSPELGKSLTAKLVDTLGDMQRAPVKVEHYRVDDELLKSSLRKAKLIGDRIGDKEKALIGDLQANIILKQSASQKPWSQENTQSLIDAEIQPIITDPSNHWWTSDKTLPAFKAAEAVPQAFIREALRRNPKLTRNAITQGYYLAKDKGLLNEDGTYKGNK